MRNPLFVANWKMNFLKKDAKEFCDAFLNELSIRNLVDFEGIWIAPPFTLLCEVSSLLSKKDSAPVLIGAQNSHWLDNGAHTGEISPKMLMDVGASFVIIGHSERRQFYAETDETAHKRLKSALSAGMKAILCIGESEAQFKAGDTKKVVLNQLRNSLGCDSGGYSSYIANARLILAYEPVWAIGTGLAATPEIAENVHSIIRDDLSSCLGDGVAQSAIILYGGSTKPDNIGELMACSNIDGALVGGASLKPDQFAELITNGRVAK